MVKSGGKNGSKMKKTKNPQRKITNRISEDVVTLFKVGIAGSFQSSAREQASVARITLEQKIVPMIANEYCSIFIVSKVNVKNVGGN